MVAVESSRVIRRSTELRAVSDFLLSAERRPSGLIIEGEAGIGKTTVLLSAIDEARDRGFAVLCARVGQAESVLAYAALADLFSGVEVSILEGLPDVQRGAVDCVLLRAGVEGAENQHMAAAAFASVLRRMSVDAPVVVAIDDLQWLDPSSRAVLAYAARRLDGRIGVLMTERCDPDCGSASTWLHLSRPGGVERVRVGQMGLAELHELIAARLGRTFARPTMMRILEISRGNPFYALELANAIHVGSARAQPFLPATLAELMRQRIGSLEGAAGDALLAAASVENPTVELLAQVLDTTVDGAVELLEEAENNSILTIDGNAVQFSHPLLAQSVYTDAKPARRRAIHRSLAEVIVLPELKARHKALGSASGDSDTLKALDDAAEVARARGAPAAAAELIELAIALGGSTASRRVRAADNHFKAGDGERARELLEPTIAELPPCPLRGIASHLMAALLNYNDSFVASANLLKRTLSDTESNPVLQAQTLIMLAFTQSLTGEFDESLRNARKAVAYAESLNFSPLTSAALALFVNLQFMYGHGVDEANLRRALDLEDPSSDVPIPLSPSAVNALINAWTGELSLARRQLAAVRDRFVECGAEIDLMVVACYATTIEIWRGNFSEAALLAEDTVKRAEQVGGSRAIALTVRAAAAAYGGREQEARADAAAVLDIAEQCGSPRLSEWPRMSLGFLEVSLGRYSEALATLQPLVDAIDSLPGVEITSYTFIPDAVEAMVGLGFYADAERLVEALEHHGARLSRHWMLAAGARCRSMLLAAQGDAIAAENLMHYALVEHRKVSMPFECARSQLLLGQLQRRRRQKEAATATLREALQSFETMGASLWAERARAELARVNVTPTGDMSLTRAERQVAELAAAGKTNNDIAAALFVSPKTVEANLTRIYRKLDINSRAQLGRVFSDSA